MTDPLLCRRRNNGPSFSIPLATFIAMCEGPKHRPIVGHPETDIAASCRRPDAKFVVDNATNPLLADKISFICLNRDAPKQELDLLTVPDNHSLKRPMPRIYAADGRSESRVVFRNGVRSFANNLPVS